MLTPPKSRHSHKRLNSPLQSAFDLMLVPIRVERAAAATGQS
jgi:hypothetical protein